MSDTDGPIQTAWPPEGRNGQLWTRLLDTFPDDLDLLTLAALLRRWEDETSTLVAYADDDGEWHDVEPHWDIPARWLQP